MRGSHYDEQSLYQTTSKRLDQVLESRLQGVFRLTGYYTGQRIDRYQWAALYGRTLTGKPGFGYEGSAWAVKSPEFNVTSWCYRPRRLDLNIAYLWNAKTLRILQRAGVFRYSDYCSRQRR